MKYRIETDEFFGIWQLLPWIIVSEPGGPPAEKHWDFSVGWLRWGVTLIVYLHSAAVEADRKEKS